MTRTCCTLLLIALSSCRVTAKPANFIATDEASEVATAAPDTAASSCPEQWYRYEPSESRIRGRLELVRRFGPPNYGESPASDTKDTVPILVLSTSISICADTLSDLNNESLERVDSVQLLGQVGFRRYTGKEVLVTGRLSRGVAGRHFYDALLQVSRVQLLAR